MIYAALTEAQIKEFEENLELNLALHIPETGRFRINIFQQRAGISLVARHIKTNIPSIDELGLPEQLKEFILEPRGLILLVGGTGTGKSTTLASIIERDCNPITFSRLRIRLNLYINITSRWLINVKSGWIPTHMRLH